MRAADRGVFFDKAALHTLRYRSATLAERAEACPGCLYACPLAPQEKALLIEKAGNETLLDASISALGLGSLCSCLCNGGSEDCRLLGQWIFALEKWCMGAVHQDAQPYPAAGDKQRHSRYRYLDALEAYVQRECEDPDDGTGVDAWTAWRQDFIEKAGSVTLTAFTAQLNTCWPGAPLLDQMSNYDELIRLPSRWEIFWRAFLLEYPVMARRLSEMIDTAVRVRRDFTRLLHECGAQVRNTFFPGSSCARVTEISSGLSDMHEDGWAVYRITYADGEKLIFKPHVSQAEDVWNAFLQEMCRLAGLPVFKTPRSLRLENGVFQEWIEQKRAENEDAISRFFFRAGFLSCVIFALGGSDFHCENVIAHGDCPVLVDVETVVGRHIGAESTILSNNLYPFLGFGKGLVPGSCAFCDMSGTQNLPTVDGERYFTGYEYGKSVLEGFLLAYRTLLRHECRLRELAGGFTGLSVRLILRPTAYYQQLITLLSRPERMRSAMDAEAGLFWLTRSYQKDLDHLPDYFVQEYRSLRALLFPKVMTTVGSGGKNKAPVPGGLRVLSEADCRRNACRVWVSLQNTRLDGGADADLSISGYGSLTGQETETLTAVCERYARLMLDVLGRRADLFAGVQERNRYFFGPDRFCMPEGLLGMAVALSASVPVTGGSSLLRDAVDTYLEALKIQIAPHSVLGFSRGLADGLGGIVRGLSVIGSHRTDSDALPMLDSLLSRLRDANGRFRCGDDASLLYGDAGLLLALSRLTGARRNGMEGLITRISEWLAPVLEDELQGGSCRRGLLSGVDGRLLALAAVPGLMPGRPLEGLYGAPAPADLSMLNGVAGISVAAARLREAGRLQAEPVLSFTGVCANDTFGCGNAGRLYAAAVRRDEAVIMPLARVLLSALQNGPRPMLAAEATLYPGFFFGEGGILYALLYALSAGRAESVI